MIKALALVAAIQIARAVLAGAKWIAPRSIYHETERSKYHESDHSSQF